MYFTVHADLGLESGDPPQILEEEVKNAPKRFHAERFMGLSNDLYLGK